MPASQTHPSKTPTMVPSSLNFHLKSPGTESLTSSAVSSLESMASQSKNACEGVNPQPMEGFRGVGEPFDGPQAFAQPGQH